MIKVPKINVYINASKPFYYPGEKFSATILIDAQEKANCNKMTIIAKGKQIIKASQVNKFLNEDKPQQVEESSSSSSDSDDNSRYRPPITDEGPIVEIKETKDIFKVHKEIIISENKTLIVGKHSFPFEIELPQDIPGTFLYLEKNTYAEVAYSVKVKLAGLNIKKLIPIVIRQKQENFNYPKTNNFERRINGCCCIVGTTSIKITATENFTKAGDPIKLMVNINNETNTTSTPITVEVYRKLLLKGANNKKIRVTKIVGAYQGKRIINAREKFQKKLHVAINTNDYLKEHINETKAFKSFKHKEIIPFLFQSIKSDNITCEFEVYAESQYANITNDDLGVFLSVLVYPIEDGVLSKSVMNIAKAFVNGILNKKIFMRGESLLKKTLEDENKKKEKKPKVKKKIYEESQGSQETIKFENKLNDDIKKKKNIESDEDEEEEGNEESESNDLNNKLNNAEKNNIDKFGMQNNDIKKNNNNNILNNYKEMSGININDNYNNNNYKLKDSKIRESKNKNSEEISFGTSSKDKNYFVNDKSSYIKKDFDKGFLNDPLDEQLSDSEK